MKKWLVYFNFSSTKSRYFTFHFFVLAGIVVVSIVRSLLHILLPDGGASTIATIPLDAYSSAAQATIVSMFAFWGLAQLMMAVVMLFILVKKKETILVLYGVLLVEYGGRLVIGMMKPFETIQTAPGAIGNYVFFFFSLGAILFHVILVRLNKRFS